VSKSVSDSTRVSLLIRIRDPGDKEAWSQFHDLYAPLLYRYARSRGLTRDDADDIRSSCYMTVVEKIGEFQYEKQRGGFKAWLRTLAHRRIVDMLRKRRRKDQGDAALETAASTEPSPDEAWETQWKNQHLKYCIERVRGKVTMQVFEAFSMLVLETKPVEEVCEHLGMNSNQVYKAKSRVIARVREELSTIGYEEMDDLQM
jgi:RNA polymerase sigma factor (sigma-70 family)